MVGNKTSLLLRIYVGELDKFKNTPLYEAIVYAAKRHGLAGATVLKGIMSYGANSFVHKANSFHFLMTCPLSLKSWMKNKKYETF